MNKSDFDADNARFSLRTIEATLNLIIEGMEQEHYNSKEYKTHFYECMEGAYMPALILVLCSIQDLLKKTEAAI